MRIAVLIVLLGMSLCTAAQTQKNIPGAVPVKLATAEDSLQYAMGIYFAQWAMRNGFNRINPTIITIAMNDVAVNRPRLVNDSLVFPLLTAYIEKASVESSKRLEDILFTALKDKPGVGKLPNGVQYLVQKAGKGITPEQTDSIVINFKGVLADGTLFEDTYAKKVAIATTPASVFPGLGDALQMMPQGSVWELYIPSSAAYGDKGNGGSIPPNSALVLLVELVSVKRNG